jgi:hypothetical protein
MLGKEFPIRINGVRTARMLPVAIFAKLSDAHARLRGELALGVLLNEPAIRVDRVGRFRRAPILLLTAAARNQQQADPDRTISCPDCDHRQHLPLAATGYCTGAPTTRRRMDWSNDERHAEATTD